ncbi:hypothetical protein M378DRAFT_133182 [Amanita muscaria Koide BX008]|uniref:Uncharacterized protein n=1 Tax=Amanita muscaria (strain Koide BX008) TaxID=946122 RepID=A0A0C2WN22_AMAMK|nr:hypothetical protein M378DRAFT_133182 [Amanita muscaria Koide BX008]
MVKLTLAAAFSAIIGVVAAQSGFQIYQPGPNWWWVAQSQNTMSWDCKNTTVSQFTIYILNTNPQVLSGKLAFIAQQNNADCSKLIDKTQLSQQTPATGYKLQFADIINGSIIYGESGEFEIKALGSTYPTSSVGSSATGTASGSTASGTSSKNNGGTSVKTSLGLGLAAIGAVLGFMTA